MYSPHPFIEQERNLPGFLRLPIELRIQIYEQVFADINPRPLLIRHYPGHQWLYRRANSVEHMPALLFVNRQISDEARDILYRSLFRESVQLIVIEHVVARTASGARPEPRDCNGMSSYRPVREIAPVLQSLPRIRLEVDVLNAMPEPQFQTKALLRWIRAVMNERPTAGPRFQGSLKSFDVVFKVWDEQTCSYHAKSKDGLFRAILGIKSVEEEPEVWFSSVSQARENRSMKKIGAGVKVDVANVACGIWESESSAWSEMRRACADEESFLSRGIRSLLGR